jgi:hypothetical protein
MHLPDPGSAKSFHILSTFSTTVSDMRVLKSHVPGMKASGGTGFPHTPI